MGNKWGLRLLFIFVTIYLVTATNTGLSAQNTTVACFEHERLALLKFKQSVTYDYGMLSSWVGTDCCRWERVTCDGVTGNVESLHLRGDYGTFYSEYLVSNELGTSLRVLKHLKYMDLSGNYFVGSQFPEFIGSLKQLTYLNLSNAGFSGVISNHIGNLSNLKSLDLSTYPEYYHMLIAHDMAWISGLSSLEYLDLSWLNLSGASILDVVPYNTPSLKVLSLSYCGLVIDDRDPLRNLSNTLSNIEHLDLRWNHFTGQLPHFFQNMTDLQSLDLSFIPLSATSNFASNFANLLSMIPSLLELHLSYCNNQETHLSHILHNLTILSNIQRLDLSSNNLTGTIPGSVRKLKSLEVLDLSDNKLTGPVPKFPQKLTELHLSYNDLNGSIPVSIGQLSKLRSLDVSYNSLEGVVFESHFANLSMLKDFNVAHNNKLIINVSHEWLPPFLLKHIDLTSCQIVNGLPQWLQSQRTLHTLRLSNTTISGPLPTWLRKMPIIPFLDLSHNNLSGPLTNLPSGVHNIDFIESSVFLQYNTFNESIPWSLCKRIDLVDLDLSNNKLNGEIPKCLKDLEDLQFLRLSSNQLSGVLPSFIGNFSSLGSLNMNDNNFSGELPEEIWNLTFLWVLDLGDNAFCGKLPEWIGDKIKRLMVFRLHNNNFTGEIPRSLCTNSELQILDVARNNLRGIIPHCLGGFLGMVKDHYRVGFGEGTEEALTQVIKGSSLEYTRNWYYFSNMDLSSNKLVGGIPVELTALSGLVGLNLSNNHLSGGIPNTIGNMTALTSLDLSGNELSGQIPPSIAALTFLSHLNLSNNNLSGPIPTGNQLQTLIDPSIYGGNKYLCGAPLPKNCSNLEDGPIAITKKKYETANEPNNVWFYVDIAWGFETGFWGVIIVLMLKKQWRRKLFVFAEESMDKIHVAVR